MSGAALSGCLQPGTGTTSLASTAGSTSVIPGGAKAVQIKFVENTTSCSNGSCPGSFNAPPTNGTSTGVGNGLHAVQLFNPDGSGLTLTSTGGTTDPNWPAWLNYVEIGISGSNNSAASSSNCANFGVGTATCNFPSGTQNCDVASTYRVSEYDCVNAGATVGNGTQSDGIYIRANFNRANLGSTENIMVVVSYAASAFDQGPSNPSNCISSGSFSPENCNDFTWRAYMHHDPSGLTNSLPDQPFLMLVPPTFSYVNGNTIAVGTQTETKQFIFPFAGDPNMTTIQFSRTGSTLKTTTTNFSNDCNGANVATGADSPLCAGMVFYSMTFFRI